MAISIGAEATDRSSSLTNNYTWISKDGPASAPGTITSVEIWAKDDLVGCRVGTFYTTNGNTLKCRDSAVIGSVISGYKRTFTEDEGESPLAIAVEAGDYIGVYYTGGRVEADSGGGAGVWWISGEHIDPDDETEYNAPAAEQMSLHGIGTEAPPGWSGKISGVTNPAKVMGVDVANIAKVKGVA